MKKILLSIVMSLLSIAGFAQEIPFKISKSELFKDEFKHSNIALAEDDGNGGILLVRTYSGGMFSGSYGYYFEHYDSNMKLIKEYEYNPKESKDVKQSGILGLISNGDEINIINFLYNKTEKAFICVSMTANIADFNFKSKELFRINSEEVKRFGMFSRVSDFDGDSGASMIVNEDRTAFAITVDIKDKESETHKIYLFDNQLNKKIEHIFKRDIKDRKFRYENIDVSKDASTLYLLGKVYSDDAKKKKEGGRYQYELTRITNDNQKTQVFDTDEHFSASLKAIVFSDRVTCIGFYSDRNDNRYKGISYFELDPITLDIKKSKFNPFTEQFMVDKYGKDKDKELRNLSFRRILITTNNDIIFNAEEFYITTHTYSTPNGGMVTRTLFHYDDIVSAKINPSGDIVWARNINKRQVSSGDNPYLSYTSTARGNDAYFFINAGEKVKKLRNDRIQFGQTSNKRSNLNVIRVNQNGDFDFQEILDDKDNEVPFMVSDGILSGDSVYFLGQKGKKKQLLKVTL
ncbi:hypothetical protein [Flavobacterium sp.]|uniref:hypothetical protein n=1 Tax=Flavobacterium sp. TaxID=239 RepID=UPI003918BF4C